MIEDEAPDGDEQTGDHSAECDAADRLSRSALRGPGADNEKALGLEVARLFGVSPRLLVARPSPPPAESTPEES